MTECAENCILPRSMVSHSQPFSHLSSLISHLSSLISHWTTLYSILYTPMILSWPMNRVSAPVRSPMSSTASRSITSGWTTSRATTSRSTTSWSTTSRSTTSRLTTSISTTFKSSSNLQQSWPPSASPDLIYHNLNVHPRVCRITVWEFIAQFTPVQLRSASPTLFEHCLLVYLQTQAIMAYKFRWSWPPTAFPIPLDHRLWVHHRVHSILESKCISKHAQLQPGSVTPNSLNCNLHVPTIMASECSSQLAQSRPQSAFLISLNHGRHVYH